MPASKVYVDTNLFIAAYVEEDATEAVLAWFARQSASILMASDWTFVELTSALGLKVRRGQISAAQADATQNLFEATMLPALVVLPVDTVVFARAQLLMRRYELGLRAPDALHLALCLAEDHSVLATADQTLHAAARRLKQPSVRVY